MAGIEIQQNVPTLDQYALTTVNNVRIQLGMPSTALDADIIARIERLINVGSSAIESYTDRFFRSRSFSEIYDGRGTNTFVPAQWPINSITELWIDQSSEFTDPVNILDADEYHIMDKATTIELLNRNFSTGRASVKIVYNAGYNSIPYDIAYACDLYVEWFYRFNEREDIGRSTRSKGDESVNLEQGMPKVVMELISKYKRIEFGGSSPRSSENI